MLAGPAAISLSVIYSTVYGPLHAIIGISVVMGIAFFFVLGGGFFSRLLGENGARVLTRILGFFTIALGVQYILTGAVNYFKAVSFGANG